MLRLSPQLSRRETSRDRQSKNPSTPVDFPVSRSRRESSFPVFHPIFCCDSETEDTSTLDTLSPRTPLNMAQNGQVVLTLRELEKEFSVVYAEVALKNNEVHLDTITQRFSMLPKSIKRQYQTDDSYSATRQRIPDQLNFGIV